MTGSSFEVSREGREIFVERSGMNENIKRPEVLGNAEEKEVEEIREGIAAEHGHEPASLADDPREVLSEKIEEPQHQTALHLTETDQSHERLITNSITAHCSSFFRKQPYLKSINIEQKRPEFGRKTMFLSEIQFHPEVS